MAVIVGGVGTAVGSGVGNGAIAVGDAETLGLGLAGSTVAGFEPHPAVNATRAIRQREIRGDEERRIRAIFGLSQMRSTARRLARRAAYRRLAC
jgi:hypothetical protein